MTTAKPPSDGLILTCSKCNQRNRVKSLPGGRRPICAKCGHPLNGPDSNSLSPKEATVLLGSLRADAWTAVNSQPDALRCYFDESWTLFRQGIEQTDWLKSMNLSRSEIESFNGYIFVSAFLSACSHLRGEIKTRDEIFNSAGILLSRFTSSLDEAGSLILVLENRFRVELVERGLLKAQRKWWRFGVGRPPPLWSSSAVQCLPCRMLPVPR